jgi:hypothetical protein
VTVRYAVAGPAESGDHYVLFLLDPYSIPSVARIIRIG